MELRGEWLRSMWRRLRQLLSKRGAAWKEALNQPNLVHALNHKVVFTDAVVSEGDELAFFPPMTGG